MKHKFYLLGGFLFLLSLSSFHLSYAMGVAEHREELGTLKEQSLEENEKGKITKLHEEAFKKVETALITQEIKQEATSKQIQSRYGAPSVITAIEDGERWLYRSLKGKGFLDKPWIFLYFDRHGKLSRWDCGHTPACPESLS